MPIATITPQNNSQTALLQQSLSSTGASLSSALNAAIQRSRDDAQTRFSQEQNLINQQQRTIENDRTERFDILDRQEAQKDREIAQPEIDLNNERKAFDLGKLERDDDFNQSQRSFALRNNADPASFKARAAAQEIRSINEGTTAADVAKDRKDRNARNDKFNDNEQAKAIRNEVTPVDVAIFNKEQTIEQNRARADLAKLKAEAEIDETKRKELNDRRNSAEKEASQLRKDIRDKGVGTGREQFTQERVDQLEQEFEQRHGFNPRTGTFDDALAVDNTGLKPNGETPEPSGDGETPEPSGDGGRVVELEDAKEVGINLTKFNELSQINSEDLTPEQKAQVEGFQNEITSLVNPRLDEIQEFALGTVLEEVGGGREGPVQEARLRTDEEIANELFEVAKQASVDRGSFGSKKEIERLQKKDPNDPKIKAIFQIRNLLFDKALQMRSQDQAVKSDNLKNAENSRLKDSNLFQ